MMVVVWETPPRAWGRLPILAKSDKTIVKHPHERGEDVAVVDDINSVIETPPRAWGRRKKNINPRLVDRNTPTSVGKTKANGRPLTEIEKHPHERGEDPSRAGGSSERRETPPRAWGRHRHSCQGPASPGNTPTSVGKTSCSHLSSLS